VGCRSGNGAIVQLAGAVVGGELDVFGASGALEPDALGLDVLGLDALGSSD
jgi:hypothetical protein